jgi:hypothetical protein
MIINRLTTWIMIKFRYFLSILIISSLFSCSQSNDGNNGYKFIGTIDPIPTALINNNSWTIGCEVLDRDYADYKSYCEFLPELGAKTARLQLGWAKCEKQKGIYNFKWMKEIAEDLKSKKIRPWLQFSYGNPIYQGGGEPTLAGGIPVSPEALKAWDNWVRETVSQFKSYTNYWEVWNEPNLPDKNKVIKTPEEYGKFFVRTAEIIRQQQPDAIISGLVLCGMHESSFDYINGFLEYLKKQGKLNLLNEMTYHPYPQIPEETYPLADSLRHVLQGYSTKITIKHGETGCPAEFNKSGVLSGHDWTEISQAKWLLRRMCGDYANNIPTSLFTIIDFTYPDTRSQGHGYTLKCGLLVSDSTTRKRISFSAVQNAITILNENWGNPKKPEYKIDQIADSVNPGDLFCYHLSNAKSGKNMLMIWQGNQVPGNSMQKRVVRISINHITFRKLVMVDLLDGKAYSISNRNYKLSGDSCITVNIPVYDSPVIITENSEINLRL